MVSMRLRATIATLRVFQRIPFGGIHSGGCAVQTLITHHFLMDSMLSLARPVFPVGFQDVWTLRLFCRCRCRSSKGKRHSCYPGEYHLHQHHTVDICMVMLALADLLGSERASVV